MIALFTGDKSGARWLADLHKVLPRHLQRRLYCFGSARDKVGIVKLAGRRAGEMFGQLLHDITGKKTGMRIGQLIDLAVHRRQHIRVCVSEAGNRRPAAGIKIRLSLGIKDIGPLGT